MGFYEFMENLNFPRRKCICGIFEASLHLWRKLVLGKIELLVRFSAFLCLTRDAMESEKLKNDETLCVSRVNLIHCNFFRVEFHFEGMRPSLEKHVNFSLSRITLRTVRDSETK